VKALYEDLVARGELPNIKGLKRELREFPPSSPPPITPAEYSGLQTAFDHLNGALFGGELPNVFITYQRRAHSGGYFGPNRFAERASKIDRHEIALNPNGFVGRTDEFIVSILLHEMVHLWQHCHGQHKPSRAYHNREWAAKMQTVGLTPSSTGMVGGKTTGAHMAHYITDGGPFSQAFATLAATGWKLNLESAPRDGGARSPPSKVKSICPVCGGNAWAKPDYAIACVACGETMIPETQAVQSYDQAAE
jgi:predicted SprT family Zn-dependent metalloprotease